MNLIELNRSLVHGLRLSGMAAVMETSPSASAVGKHGAYRPDLHPGL